VREAVRVGDGAALSTSLAFGGMNSALALGGA
jgi:hypothetical protein